jgi:hypothetical protein
MFSFSEEETYKGDAASCTLSSILTLLSYYSKNYHTTSGCFLRSLARKTEPTWSCSARLLEKQYLSRRSFLLSVFHPRTQAMQKPKVTQMALMTLLSLVSNFQPTCACFSDLSKLQVVLTMIFRSTFPNPQHEIYVFCSCHRKSVLKSLELSALCFFSSYLCFPHSKIATSSFDGRAFACSKMYTIVDTCPGGYILFPNLILMAFLPYTRKRHVRLAHVCVFLENWAFRQRVAFCSLPLALTLTPSAFENTEDNGTMFSRFLARKVSTLLIITQASF